MAIISRKALLLGLGAIGCSGSKGAPAVESGFTAQVTSVSAGGTPQQHETLSVGPSPPGPGDEASAPSTGGVPAPLLEGNSVQPTPLGTRDEAVPPLLDAEGRPLPQTDEKPSAQSASLMVRLELLTRAIAENKPEIALPAFFPVEAYNQVKAIEHPELDHKKRLVGAFERNIADYHKRLGASAAIRFVRVEVPEPSIKWMKPGSEGNRVGYYRVLRSKLVVLGADGKEHSFEITSMISWRGEWYVVHLNGFK